MDVYQPSAKVRSIAAVGCSYLLVNKNNWRTFSKIDRLLVVYIAVYDCNQGPGAGYVPVSSLSPHSCLECVHQQASSTVIIAAGKQSMNLSSAPGDVSCQYGIHNNVLVV